MLPELVGRTGDDKVIGQADAVDLGTGLRAFLPDVAWQGCPQAGCQAVQDPMRHDGGAEAPWRGSCLRRMEAMPFPVPRLQPLTHNALGHRDMRQEPRVTDCV